MKNPDFDLKKLSLDTKDWYDAYYKNNGSERNDIVKNTGARWQGFFSDIGYLDALAFVLRSLPVDSMSARVLDVGCGSGGSCLPYLKFMPAQNITGIDLLESRIAEGKHLYPGIDFRVGSASNMQFGDAIFDIVSESTMFVQMTDEGLASSIANEMIRVTKPSGYILLRDWTTPLRPADSMYAPLTKQRLARLFKIGPSTRVITRKKGALLPPLGRQIGRFAPFLYQFFQLVPFATAQHTIVLQRI